MTWSDGRASFRGKYIKVIRIEGDMTFSQGRLHFSGKDPGILWRKKTEDYIKRKLRMYLDESTPLSELPRGR